MSTAWMPSVLACYCTWGGLTKRAAMHHGWFNAVHPDDQPLVAIPGAPPNMSNLPAGCPFSPRCAWAQSHCAVDQPALLPVGGSAGHVRACHRSPEDVVQAMERAQ